MNRRPVLTLLAVAGAIVVSGGCSSSKNKPAQMTPAPALSAALVFSPDMMDSPAHFDGLNALEMRLLASRNDVYRGGAGAVPEVADPGAYSIVTRDFQRTNNGRPWNHWSSETRVFQRGAGR